MSILLDLFSESLPPKSKFNVENIPDLSGKVIVVTGGNTGIGYHTVSALLSHNAKVYVLARNRTKAEGALKKLEEETGKKAELLIGDLADIASVKNAAKELRGKETHLDVLFNSGGVMVPPIEQLTKDGYDLQFGTNVIGHGVLTLEVLPLLLEGARRSKDGKARVVNTSSSAAYFTKTIDFDAIRDDDGDNKRRTKKGVEFLYLQSKFGNVLFSNELARRYGDQGIVSTALNPGNLKTELQRHLTGIRERVINLFLYPAPYGALTQLYAGTSPEGAEFNGKWLVPWARVKERQPKGADNAETAKGLWEYIEQAREKY